jgi:hypothetical protein
MGLRTLAKPFPFLLAEPFLTLVVEPEPRVFLL